MTNAGQERGGSSAWRRLVLLGVMIAFVAWFVLFLIMLGGFFFKHEGKLYADILACFFGHEKTQELTAGGHFARNLGFGLLALGGITMAAWRNREMSRQAEAAQKQINNESDRIAGKRFSDGVKMLAQNNENSNSAIAVRIGGMYALQSLANNYVVEYAAQVVKTLVAYVRVNVQLTKIKCEYLEVDFLGEDVKTAFAVLAQLLAACSESPEKKFDLSGKKFELSDNDLKFSDCDFSRLCLDYRQVSGLRHYKWQGSDLRGSDLRFANFRGARMHGAQLQGANLCGVNLKGACLHNADLRGARLGMGNTNKKFELTNLQGAKLQGAKLRGAKLRGADLRGVDLQGADLRGAMFSGVCAGFAADLSCADLNGAKLQDTDLRKANLSSVKDLPGLLANQIWHSKQPGLENVESIETPSNRVWDLEPYWGCPYALAGVLRNYTIIYKNGDSASSSNELLKAAHKLLKNDQLPSEFSENWQEWLNKFDSELGHPNFREEKSLFSYSWPIEFRKGKAAGTLAFVGESNSRE